LAATPVKSENFHEEPLGVLELGILVFVATALLVGVVLLREPSLLLPVVVLGLPIEYFATVTVDELGGGGVAGAVRALLVPGKAAMLAVVGIGVLRLRHEPGRLFPNSAVLFPVALLVAITFIGLGWADRKLPPNAILILPMYAAFVFVAPSLIRERRDFERIWAAMFAIAIFVSLIAVVQRFGVFNWREILIQSDEVSYRSNATFGDPNILARYLAMTIPLAAALILATGPRRLTVYLAAPALVIGLAGIIASASRSGWLILLFIGFLAVMWSPIRGYTKLALTTVSVSLVGGLLVLLFLQGGANADRVRTLWSGVEVIGQREFLIRAGIAMWQDNPVIGVGSGNYQSSLIANYLHLIPSWARTTLSHTSLVSVLAELGIVGAAAFSFIIFRIALATVAIYRRAREEPYARLVTGWLAASLLGIVLHSQSEGRLIDEPYLWLLLALLVAVETRRRSIEAVPESVAVEAAATARAPARAVQPAHPEPIGDPA
jgi:O-antigen ligase